MAPSISFAHEQSPTTSDLGSLLVQGLVRGSALLGLVLRSAAGAISHVVPYTVVPLFLYFFVSRTIRSVGQLFIWTPLDRSS